MRAAIQERRAVLGLINQAEKYQIREKMKKDVISSSYAISCS
jgi:hypothetical protein